MPRLALSILLLVAASAARAGAIYPIDRAAILAGSRFDFKVEFDAASEVADVKVSVNGADYVQALGGKPAFVARENGKDGAAVTLRNVSIAKPGKYAVEATDGKQILRATWEVFGTGPRRAKNVILFIGDGMTMANRTAARILSKGIREGKYYGALSFDDMPHMALIGTSGVDSIVTDSANSMSAYTTGHKSSVNALGVYAARNANNFEHPKVETIAELIKRRTKMAVGVVSDAEVQDATPAGVVAHTRRRSDKAEITEMFFLSRVEVLMGGGLAYFLPQGVTGSKRKDGNDFIELFRRDGYAYAASNGEMKEHAGKPGTTKLLGLFHPENMDGALDRRVLKRGTVSKFPAQPDVADMTRAAIQVLSRNKDGFFLMVEAALIDKFNHPLDWERAVFDTIMLSNAVQVAKDFAGKRNDTLIIVTPDHTHGLAIVGTVDDGKSGADMRERVGTYAEAGYPNYPAPDKDGYPPSVDVSKRLAVFFADFPDYYETYRPKLDGPFEPAVKDTTGKQYAANEKYKEGAQLRGGNLPRSSDVGVHAADDAVLTAMGPGSEKFRGFMDNTEVFRVIADTLGLAPGAKAAR
ncbi:MAG TPA: alkaline phosphatase [Burkholderiales bacterium]|nr:alkaline phosphatase [Burkholderiales bacterium]